MGRDKAKDDKHFNCNQSHEVAYVANLYGVSRERVMLFLIKKCKDGAIKYATHKEVYQLIKNELGLDIPV